MSDRNDEGVAREPLEILTPEDLPRLAQFLTAYLHEDWNQDYDSAAEAVYDYLVEADLNDVEELAAEWGAFTRATRGLPLDEVNRILAGRFGSGWRVLSRAEIDGVSQEIGNAVGE
jgi:hypothetical protein